MAFRTIDDIQAHLGETHLGAHVFALLERDPLLRIVPMQRWSGDGNKKTYPYEKSVPAATWVDFDENYVDVALEEGERTAFLKKLEIQSTLPLSSRGRSFNRTKRQKRLHMLRQWRGMGRTLRQTISTGRHAKSVIGATILALGLSAVKVSPQVGVGQIKIDWDDSEDELKFQFPGETTFGPVIVFADDIQEFPIFGSDDKNWALITVDHSVLEAGGDFISDGTAAEEITVSFNKTIDGIDSLIHPDQRCWGTLKKLGNLLSAGPSTNGDSVARKHLDAVIQKNKAPEELQAIIVPEQLEIPILDFIKTEGPGTPWNLWKGRELAQGIGEYRGRPVFIIDGMPSITVGTSVTHPIFCVGFDLENGVHLEAQNALDDPEDLLEAAARDAVISAMEVVEGEFMLPVYGRWLAEQKDGPRNTYRVDGEFSLIARNDQWTSAVQGLKA